MLQLEFDLILYQILQDQRVLLLDNLWQKKQSEIEKLCEEIEFKINPETIVDTSKILFIKTNPIDCIRFDVTIDKDSVVFEKS